MNENKTDIERHMAFLVQVLLFTVLAINATQFLLKSKFI